MQFAQACIFIVALLAVIGNAIAQECKLSIESASLRASNSHLRIRGNISIGNKNCKPTSSNSDNVKTAIIFTSKKNLKITDAKHIVHAGNECTITANWYNTPDKYSSSKDTQIFIPTRYITNIRCNKDTTSVITTKNTTIKKRATTSKKTTTKKATTTKKSTTKKTTTKKTTTKKTTTKKTTTKKTTTKKTTTKKTTTTKKSTTSSSSGGYSGQATFFTPNTGACGIKNKSTDMIAALGGSLYGNFDKKSAYCGRKIEVTNTANGKSVVVTVEDACESCAKTHVDLSPAAFAKIGKFDTGVLKVNWHFL